MAAMMPGAPGWEEYAFARGAGAYELRAEMLGLEGPEEYLEFQRLSELPPTPEEQARTALEEAISTAYIEGYAIPEPELGQDVYGYIEATPGVTYIPGVREVAEAVGEPVYTPPTVVTQPAFTYAEVPPGRAGPLGPTPYVAEAGFPLAGLATVGLLVLSWDEIMEALVSVIKFGKEVWNLLAGIGLVGGGGAPEDYYNVIP